MFLVGTSMGNSLHDQLLKAGLVDKKKANQVKDAQRNKKNHATQEAESAKIKADAEKARLEKLEKDRLLNEEKQAQANAKAVRAQVVQLINMNKQRRGDGEQPFNFVDGTLVKKLYVTQEMLVALTRGQLVIVKNASDVHSVSYEVVPKIVADKIQEREPSWVFVNKDATAASTEVEDDYYADYKIPDDLMW